MNLRKKDSVAKVSKTLEIAINNLFLVLKSPLNDARGSIITLPRNFL